MVDPEPIWVGLRKDHWGKFGQGGSVIKAVFVSGVKKNGKTFYTSDGVWQHRKIRSNGKLIYLTIK